MLFEGRPSSDCGDLSRAKLKPLSIHIREGLAILNGTSAMTGIGMVNILQARKLIAGYGPCCCPPMTDEIVEAFDDHYSYEIEMSYQAS